MAEKKILSFDDTLKDLEKKYGKGCVLHGKGQVEEVETIDTGSIGLNNALGIGGLPQGKLVEIFGWESSGKSTLCQMIVGNAQKKGMKCIYVDAENSIDREYATALGVDVDDLYIIQMDETAGEGAYNKVERLVETGEVGLVIYDSYNALQPKAIVEGEVGDSTMGKHARMLGQAVMKANVLSTRYGTTFVFIGQLREKIGVMFGSPETTQGGNALKFYAHVRMQVTRSTSKENSVMDGDQKLGNKTTVKVIKNKLAPPFTSCSFNIIYSLGVDKIQEIIDLGKDTEILKVRAEVVTYEDTKYPLAEFKDLLINNPEFMEKIREEILSLLKPTITEDAEV